MAMMMELLLMMMMANVTDGHASHDDDAKAIDDHDFDDDGADW